MVGARLSLIAGTINKSCRVNSAPRLLFLSLSSRPRAKQKNPESHAAPRDYPFAPFSGANDGSFGQMLVAGEIRHCNDDSTGEKLTIAGRVPARRPALSSFVRRISLKKQVCQSQPESHPERNSPRDGETARFNLLLRARASVP